MYAKATKYLVKCHNKNQDKNTTIDFCELCDIINALICFEVRCQSVKCITKARCQRGKRKCMVVTICIGSSCHLKGSRKIVEKFNELVKASQLEEKIDLNGSFCMGECMNGVCVRVDGQLFSVLPETAEAFFEKEILGHLQ